MTLAGPRTAPDRVERDSTTRDGPTESAFGSEGWGFESLQARQVDVQPEAVPKPETASVASGKGPTSNGFSNGSVGTPCHGVVRTLRNGKEAGLEAAGKPLVSRFDKFVSFVFLVV